MSVKNFENEFNEAVEIRQELNNVLWKDYQNLQIVFEALYGENLLKKISDANYYQGGYPSENSPPRIESISKSIAQVAKYFALLGRLDEVNTVLKEYGLRIESFEDAVQYNPSGVNENKKKIERALKKVRDKYSDFEVLDDKQAMLEWFLEKTKNLQGVICSRADEIKIEIFGKVELLDNTIDKTGFTSAVNIAAAKKTKIERGKDTDGLVERATEKADTMRANGDLLEEVVLTK